MRLFLALDLAEDDRRALAGLQRHLSGGRAVSPDLFHITIAFLGETVRETEAEELHASLEAATLRSASIRLNGIGHFGHDDPTAIWVGVSPSEALQPLHARITRLARMAGLDLPRRRFVPHVTLARYSRGDPFATRDLATLLTRNAAFAGPAFTPAALHLMQSHLTGQGPDYQHLASYPLT